MLPKTHIQVYQELLSVLLTMRDRSTDVHPDADALQKNYLRVQQVFQQAMSLNSDQLNSDTAFLWQSVQTEIYRALRLLETDLLFLRSSKQAATVEQRLTNIQNRIEKVIGYCQAIVNEQ
ncbi:MAG: heterocyst frequency control protein PatD [Cyanophyceae cyanobacterium]